MCPCPYTLQPWPSLPTFPLSLPISDLLLCQSPQPWVSLLSSHQPERCSTTAAGPHSMLPAGAEAVSSPPVVFLKQLYRCVQLYLCATQGIL